MQRSLIVVVSLQGSTASNRISFIPHSQRIADLPQKVFLNRPNRVNRSHIGLHSENLQSQTRPLLDNLIRVVCILRRYRVGLPFNIRRNILINPLAVQASFDPENPFAGLQHTFRAMKTDKGPDRVKIPVGFTEVTIASTCTISVIDRTP